MPRKILKGFTLIELLVVMAIISILSGAGVVAYSSYTSAAKETATKKNHTKILNGINELRLKNNPIKLKKSDISNIIIT